MDEEERKNAEIHSKELLESVGIKLIGRQRKRRDSSHGSFNDALLIA